MRYRRSNAILRFYCVSSTISLALILFAGFLHPSFAFRTGESASLVIGQSSFTTDHCLGSVFGSPTQSGLCGPFGSTFDPSGNLWVSDFDNHRVLEFTPPFSNGENASVVIGQASFTTNNFCGPVIQSRFCLPKGIAFDPLGNLWVSDFDNHRVLEFTPPFSNGEGASLVIGQLSFTGSTCSTTQSGLCRPSGLAFDSKGDLWVSEEINNRILGFTPPFANGESASFVIGQSSFTTNICSGGLGGTPSQSGLCGPVGLASDSKGNLLVSDSANSRVLEFERPLSNGESASFVIGQSSFSTSTCAGEFGTGPTQSGLCFPSSIALDLKGNLWVVDGAINNRVLAFVRHHRL